VDGHCFKKIVLFFICCHINCSLEHAYSTFGRPLFESWLKACCFVINIQLEELQNVPEKSKTELEKLEEKKNDLEVLCYFGF